MDRIESFAVNHLTLKPGIYVSRKDVVGEHIVTTFDIRIMRPNWEPVINTAELHTIEHLAATYLRNHETYAKDVIYFGPMGCRTGFYLILKTDCQSQDIVNLLDDMFTFITDFEGDIPGASAIECGNYTDMNLPMAKVIAQKFIDEVITNINENQLNYPV